MTRTIRGLCAGTAFFLLGAASPGSAGGVAAGLGSVHFASSCGASVAPAVDRGFALLYSFWYDRALDTFKDVIARDPGCAIAYWGAAMTYNLPLWGPPTA